MNDFSNNDHSIGLLSSITNILFVYIPTLLKTFLNIVFQIFLRIHSIFPDILEIVITAIEKIRIFLKSYFNLFRL